jgi:DNA repair exonuclease SbcCD ATPase subunit
MPCSPKEREWYQYWRQASGTPLDDYRSKYEQAANLLRKREETIRVQEERIVELERELERLGGAYQQREQTNEAHTKEISRLEGWLKSAHEALNKYEPIRNTQDSRSLTDDGDKWSSCHACGRPIDYCRCGG